MLLVNFKDYAKYPMTIFSGFFKFAVTFIIPVGFISFYPSQFFLRPNQISILVIISPVIGIAYFIFAYFIWSRGASRYSGTGS
jgi:ABC-2 type transport system permease protein